MSVKDANTGNVHIVIPEVYKCLADLKPRNTLYGNTHTARTTLIFKISNHPLQHQAPMQLMKAYELAETSQKTSITSQ